MNPMAGIWRRIGVAAMVCALPALPALALQGGVVDSNASATFAGVGSLTVAGAGTFSGVLIAPQYVLTAGHVAGPGADPSLFTFNVNLDALPAGERSFAVTDITPAPGFGGFLTGQITRNDLSILRLDRPVPDAVPRYALLTDALALGQEITLVGYGGTGAATKRQGTNIVDVLDATPGAVPDVFAYDFDNDTSNQATVIGGDSGSGMFVNDAGVWKLAGINTFSWENPGVPGTGTVRGGGGMIVSFHAAWIDSVVAVPEPAAWAMLAPGILLVLGLARYARPPRGSSVPRGSNTGQA
jgi:V8-like Glu-specific endopeptidase